MKTTLLPLLIVAVLTPQVCNASAVPEAPEQTILKLERQWHRSEKTNDPTLLAPLLSERIIYTADNGKMLSKSQVISLARQIKWESAVDVGNKAISFGDTAIATGVFIGKGTISGKTIVQKIRWTDTWLKMPSGNWQCIASQSTPLKN